MRKNQPKIPWVLIVDDDADFADALGNQLSATGYRVLTAHSIAEALRKLGNQKFFCILVDLRLSHASGEDIIVQVKSNLGSLNATTPILVISGFLEKKNIIDLRDKVAGFFVKPFSVETVARRMRELSEPAVPSTAPNGEKNDRRRSA